MDECVHQKIVSLGTRREKKWHITAIDTVSVPLIALYITDAIPSVFATMSSILYNSNDTPYVVAPTYQSLTCPLTTSYHSPAASYSSPFKKNSVKNLLYLKKSIKKTSFITCGVKKIILIKEHPNLWVNDYLDYKQFWKLMSVIVLGTPLNKNDTVSTIVNQAVAVGCFPKPSMCAFNNYECGIVSMT